MPDKTIWEMVCHTMTQPSEWQYDAVGDRLYQVALREVLKISRI
jgi:hypothetical protein